MEEEGEGAALVKRAVRVSTPCEETWEESLSLREQRLRAIVAVLKDQGVRTVADLGCGEGNLLKALLADRDFQMVAGMDVSYRTF